MPKKIYKKGTDKKLTEVGILPSSDEWNGKSNVGHTHAISDIKNLQSKLDTIPSIKTLNTNNSSTLSVSSSEARSGSGSINLHKVSKTGKFSDLNNRGEEYLTWGGSSQSGNVSPIGMCLSSEHSANRVALINPDALTFEYSSDGGATWTAYSYSGRTKTQFCTSSLSLPIGRPNASTNLVANKSKTRITITAQNGTTGYVYTSLKKMLVNISSATSLSMLIEARTGTNYKNNGAWSSIGTYNLSGWSGWNDIPLNLRFGGSNTQTSQYWQMRLTVSCPTVSSSYPKTAEIISIRLFGDNCWTAPSTLAQTGNIYTYDMEGNAKFPKKLYVNESKEVVTTGHTTSKSKTGISVSVSASKPAFTGTAHGHTITDNGHHHSYQKATSATFTGTAHGHTATDSGHTHKYSEVTKIDLTNPVHTHEATDSGHTHSYVKTTGATFAGTAFNITHHTYSLDYNPNTYTLKLGSATSTSSVTPAGSITLKTENATTGSGKASVTLTKVAQNTSVSKIWMIDTDSGTGKANVSVSNTTAGGSVSLGYTATDTGSSSTGITLANATAGGSVSTPTCTATVTDNGHTHTL